MVQSAQGVFINKDSTRQYFKRFLLAAGKSEDCQ